MTSTWTIVLSLLVLVLPAFAKAITACDWNVFWTAVSAVSTTLAVLVALWLPFHQERQRRNEDDDKMRFLYSDIFFEVDRSLSIFVEAKQLATYTAETTEDNWYQCRIRDVEECALNSRKVLRHLLRRDGLADGVIRRALDAIDLNKETAKSVAKLYDWTTHEQGGEEFDRHLVRRDRVLHDLEDHRVRVGLEARETMEEPEVTPEAENAADSPAEKT